MPSIEATRRWKAEKMAAGYCAHCFKQKAGGANGTLRLCGRCASDHRVRWHRLQSGLKNLGWRKRKNSRATKQRIAESMRRHWAQKKVAKGIIG